MIGALLFALMVASLFLAGLAAVWRWTSADIDQGVTLPDPRRVADDDTARIEPTNIRDLPRSRQSFEEYA